MSCEWCERSQASQRRECQEFNLIYVFIIAHGTMAELIHTHRRRFMPPIHFIVRFVGIVGGGGGAFHVARIKIE